MTTSPEEQQLTAALNKLTTDFADNVSSVSRVVNPLLSVWSLAHDIDPELAQPLEGLLASLAHRVLTTHTELVTAIDEVRLRLTRRESMASEVGAS